MFSVVRPRRRAVSIQSNCSANMNDMIVGCLLAGTKHLTPHPLPARKQTNEQAVLLTITQKEIPQNC